MFSELLLLCFFTFRLTQIEMRGMKKTQACPHDWSSQSSGRCYGNPQQNLKLPGVVTGVCGMAEW